MAGLSHPHKIFPEQPRTPKGAGRALSPGLHAVLVSTCCALAVICASAASAAHTPLFLWEAKAEYGDRVYLFGSLHYAKPSVYPLSSTVEQAYSLATAVGVEVDLARPEAAEVAEWLGRYSGDKRLQRDVPPALLKEVQRFSRKQGWDMERIARTRPWVVASMITGADFEAHGFRRTLGTDLYFIHAARRDAKRLVELEAMRQQFAGLNTISSADQVYLLRESLVSSKSGENALTLSKMVDAWSRGDPVGFKQVAEASLLNAPNPEALSIAFYKKRNENMAQNIDALVRSGERLFVVVGAAHLAGPDSLLDVLRAKGFLVRQVYQFTPPGSAP